MKHLLYAFLLLSALNVLDSTEAFAQKKKSAKKPVSAKPKTNKKISSNAKVGDRYFDNEEYFLAAEYFNKALKEDANDHYAAYRLGEAYRAYFDYNKAEKSYARVVSVAPKEFPLAAFWYASMLKTNGKYDEAKLVYESFVASFQPTTDDDKAILEHSKLELKGCEVALIEMKKPQRDYEFKVLPRPANSDYSDYAPVIFENDSSIVLTSARPGAKGGEKDPRMGGMFSDNFRFMSKGGAWVANKANDGFEDLNTNQNDGAGVFSKDKNKYYYTSCEGDYCQIMVSNKKNNKWGRPVALNANINIVGYPNKQPALNALGDTLFFVSTRPGGKGQNDIWYSVLQSGGEENWGPAVNLAAVNTAYIDMSPCFYAPEKTLFFASNGHEGFGGLDIFMARGANFEKVENAGLPFNSNRDDFYFVLGEKYGYLSSNREGGLGHDDIYLYRITTKGNSVIAAISKDSLGKAGFESVSVEGTIVDAKTNQPVSNETVALQDGNNNTLKTTQTNKEGEFRMDNLPANSDMKVAVAGEKNAKLTNKGNYNVKNVKVKGSKQKSSTTLFENIYFDFGKSELRPEASKVLDDLYAYAEKYPEIQIEMNANTDNIGSTEINQQLSEQRGETAKNYLSGKGLDNTRIVVNALGASKPMVSNNNPVGRQLNRRVEFYILGGPGYKASTMAYVVQPNKLSIDKVAQQFGMTPEELKALNNLDSDELQAYKPLRVRRIGEEGVAPVTMIETSKKGTSVAGVAKSGSSSNVGPLKSGEEVYTVEPQNTLFSISRLYGMTVDELMDLNSLNSNQINVGQKLKVKRHQDLESSDGSTYVVREGDTMYSIATRFGMKPNELKDLNGLDSYVLYERMVLKVKK